MADNVTADPGSGGDTFASDDIGGVQYPRTKVTWGADGTATDTAAGAAALPIQDGGNSITVDGTVTVNLAAGTNNVGDVDVLSIAAGNNNIGDVDVASIAAGNNNIGDVDVASVVPGVAATNLGKAEDAAAASADVGVVALAVRRDSAVVGSDTDGDYSTLNVDANGKLWVNAGGVTLTVASHAVTNAGTFATQVDGAALTALQLIDDPVLTDDAVFTPATSKVMMAGFHADEVSIDSLDEGDAGAARMTLDRKQIVTIEPHTSGGALVYRSLDLDEGTLEVVKNSPGNVYAIWVTNTATTTRWIKFYDATSGTAGTGTPVITFGIPGNTSDDISGGLGIGSLGITFTTGICVGATTGVADNDTGAPGTNDVIVNIFYK